MSKSQRKRRLRRRQIASQPGLTARRAGVAITGTLLSTAGLAVVPGAVQATPALPDAAAARAGTPAVGLVEDVRPGPNDASIGQIVDLDGRALLAMDDGRHGRELWVSDGSEAGTKMLVDLNTVPRTSSSGTRPGSSSPYSMVRSGDLIFFSADDGVHGRELWRTDGTVAGTQRLTDVTDNDGEYSYNYPSNLTDVGGTLYFALDDGVHGRELWTSDGTVAGTSMVADINTQVRGTAALGSSPSDFTAVGDTVFFTADNGLVGRELWKTDGTAEGTALVSDINTQVSTGYYGGRPASSGPRYLEALGDALYFSADDGLSGRELWTSDGTEAGTHLVEDIRPGTIPSDGDSYGYSGDRPWSSRPTGITAVGDALYFSADDGEHGAELWRSDGTAEGTAMVADINPTEEGYSYFGYYGVTVLDGTLYFATDDGTHGMELWASDGTAAGTRLVKDIAPGSSRGRALSSYPRDLTVVGDDIYFVARDADGERQLWTSDGSTAGTRVFADPAGDSRSSYGPNNLTAVGNELYFAADDGVYGNELWSTDEAARSHPRVTNTKKPKISGEVVAGGVLTVTPGSWMPASDLDHAYQWYVGGRAVKTATRQRFRPGSSDVGKRISVRVITLRDGYRGAVAYSAPTALVADEPLVNLTKPAARGQATVGKTLTATRGRWSVRNLKFRFAWSIAGKPVRGADERTFRLPASAAGKKVTVRVTAVRPAGAKSARSMPRSVSRRG